MAGTDHEDDPTPADEHASGIRQRVRTPRGGVPTLFVGRSTGTHAALESDEIPTLALEPLDPLDIRIDSRFEAIFPASFDVRLQRHNDKRFRKVWGWLGGIAGTAVVALLAAGKSWLTDAKSEGAAEYRIQIIERDAARDRAAAESEINRLRLELDALRATLYRGSRRDDQPDPPVTGASKRTLP